MFGREKIYDVQEQPKPQMKGVQEKHTVSYPKCDVCGSNVHFAVEFTDIKARRDEYNRTVYHSTYFQPTTICKGCLATALEFPIDPKKCNYCGK